MRYLFISDFHLGSPLFSHEYELTNILTDNYDRVFLVGDILDIQEDSLDRISVIYRELIDTINSLKNVTILKGNHDPSIDVLRTMFPKAIVSNKRIEPFGIVFHGDEFDKFLGTFLYKPSFLLFYMLERVGINIKMIARRTCAHILSFVNVKPIDSLLFHYEKEAVNQYCGYFKNIIMGHSHMPKIVHMGRNKYTGCKYINCGDWICNKTYVEYTDGEFKLLGV